MKKVFVVILGIASFSCGTGKKELKTDVEMKQVLLETSLGCAADSVACAHFEVNYPVFPGLDNAVQTKVQERLAASITSGEKEVVTSIEEEGKKFVDEYTAFKTETPDYTAGWYRQVDITLLSFSDSLLSLQLTDESYAGAPMETMH